MTNIILNSDSYKASMHTSYPENTKGVFSYVESRGGRYKETVVFGIQAFIKEYLLNPITQAMIDEADRLWTAHGEPFNREGWQYILDNHNGYLPVRIKGVPEGTVLPVKNVMLTIENTDEKCYWLTTFLETALLRAIWFPTTVATNSREIKKIIKNYLDETGDPAGLAFKLHDFGARGTSSLESAGIGGAAHLINFLGTDTMSGIVHAMKYYNTDVCGFSIPATEHSISTAWGKENEVGYARAMIDRFLLEKDFALVATVGDTYNIWQYVKILGTELKDKIVGLGNLGKTLVVRPDSGDPTVVPVQVIELLMGYFGWEMNDKGYRVLPSYIRVIQGDGVNADSITTILENMKVRKMSADNIAFGMGGQLLGSPQRDDQKFAMKASAVKIGDEWVPIKKDPITDPGKESKAGRLTLTSDYVTVDESTDEGILQVVYEDGKLLVDDTFEAIRERAAV